MIAFFGRFRLCALWVAAGILLFSDLAFSEADSVDFETLTPELTGWSGTISDRGTPGQYRPAAKWDAPIAFALDSVKPHSGATCLKWEFSQDVPGLATLRTPSLPVAGPNGSVSFFVRSQGITEEGILSFDELSADGQKVKGHWMVARIVNSEDWQEVKWSGPLDASTASIRLAFTYKTIPAGAQVWLDDLTVK
ncbi:MAG: hypothetical protein ACOYMS_08680 [Terrimicrobiaceae bacterium]